MRYDTDCRSREIFRARAALVLGREAAARAPHRWADHLGRHHRQAAGHAPAALPRRRVDTGAGRRLGAEPNGRRPRRRGPAALGWRADRRLPWAASPAGPGHGCGRGLAAAAIGRDRGDTDELAAARPPATPPGVGPPQPGGPGPGRRAAAARGGVRRSARVDRGTAGAGHDAGPVSGRGPGRGAGRGDGVRGHEGRRPAPGERRGRHGRLARLGTGRRDRVADGRRYR